MKSLTITQKITSRSCYSINEYIKEIAKTKLLGNIQEIELLREARNGNSEAFEKLITSNLRFVFSVAKHYEHVGLPFEDLINEGNIGLLKAVETFDESRGFKFITYAVWHIRSNILDAINKYGRIVYVPEKKILQLYNADKYVERFEQLYGYEPDLIDISEHLGVSEQNLKEIFNSFRMSFSPDDLSDYSDADNKYIKESLYLAEDYNSISISPDYNRESLILLLEPFLNSLSFKEREVLDMYYGLQGHEAVGMSAISEKLSMTVEACRSIKNKSIRKLMNLKGINELKDYL
ncbi:MAG: sigma-70 family RNA polymerase sigma factor [Culturomica sp.]|jgi:RNA polymerase primary sigma factor|nr:sigma-70 family RNA polymerase sigma factor [Culturomica sp.]